MKKINFKQPKYVIPAIVLPFAFLFNYLYLDMTKPARAQGKQITLNQSEGILTELPDANLKKRKINDKFGASVEQNKYRTDASAIRELDQNRGNTADYGSVYTPEERRMLDSMNAAILTDKPQGDFMARVNTRQQQDRSRYVASSPAATSRPARPIKEESAYEKEMRLFKAQMKYIDSLDRAGREPSPQSRQMLEKASQAMSQQQQPKVEEVEPEAVRKSANPNISYFNTVTDAKTEQFIKAILDEGLTVRDGGRIRIRLLDDIFVSDFEIKKGSYLFGIVTGFTGQRVEISISSLLYGNQIIPVNLSIYDNDGMSGLYVPASQFRDFTKELAARTTQGQSMSFEQDPSNQNEMMFKMMDRMVQTTTRAAGKAFKENKAKLKYNTTVYLIDNKAKRK
ncbi:conjugative transposon protein TraM [Rufibacter sp. XAAS-G3-1]|uniref:conjugative transposon protein TraM n=1 Tax=Rufibacter sp. XAAS-G3-1 TaxID=2729134 RepID=UPI0015E70011|nr:conjugative transposon protein TraM [Rufibacter sp. XAAS-G3-1]